METVRVLGEGTYGVVSLVKRTNAKSTDATFGHEYLAKKSSRVQCADNLRKELRILSRFRGCPGIVHCFDNNLELDFSGVDLVYSLYLEYAPGGTLHDLIKNNGGRLEERDVRCYARMILQGLSALHLEFYVHCDLKPENILVFPSCNGWELKISDFGLAKEPDDDDIMITPGCRGTCIYMPPESAGPPGLIGTAVDIWSLGCVVLEMLGSYATTKVGKRWVWPVPKGLSREAEDFLKRCMEEKLMERWTADELLRHPFILQDGSSVAPTPVPVFLPPSDNHPVPSCLHV